MMTLQPYHLRQRLESLAAEIVSYAVAVGDSSSPVLHQHDLPMAQEQVRALLNPWLASYGFCLEISAHALMTAPLPSIAPLRG